MNKIPRPSSKVNLSMTSVEVNHPVNFLLMTRNRAEITQPHCIDEGIFKMSEKIIGHGRGFQNELRKLANECPNHG